MLRDFFHFVKETAGRPGRSSLERLGRQAGHSYPLWKMVRNSHLGIEEVRQILIMIKQAR